MPQLDFATYAGQLFWLAISFVTLYVLVSRLILPSIGNVVDARANNIASNLDEAEKANNQADETDAKAQKMLTESSNKARGLIAESSAKAKAKMEVKRAELATKLEQKIKKAEEEIAKIEKESEDVVAKLSGELASGIANKIIKAA